MPDLYNGNIKSGPVSLTPFFSWAVLKLLISIDLYSGNILTNERPSSCQHSAHFQLFPILGLVRVLPRHSLCSPLNSSSHRWVLCYNALNFTPRIKGLGSGLALALASFDVRQIYQLICGSLCPHQQNGNNSQDWDKNKNETKNMKELWYRNIRRMDCSGLVDSGMRANI